MKRCFRCLRYLALDCFYRHPEMSDGLLGKCKECARADVRKNRAARKEKYAKYESERSKTSHRRSLAIKYQRERRRRDPKKDAARSAVSRAVRRGVLARLPCAVCGNPKSQGHHKSYDRPLDVAWLCWEHHMEVHGKAALI